MPAKKRLIAGEASAGIFLGDDAGDAFQLVGVAGAAVVGRKPQVIVYEEGRRRRTSAHHPYAWSVVSAQGVGHIAGVKVRACVGKHDHELVVAGVGDAVRLLCGRDTRVYVFALHEHVHLQVDGSGVGLK